MSAVVLIIKLSVVEIIPDVRNTIMVGVGKCSVLLLQPEIL